MFPPSHQDPGSAVLSDQELQEAIIIVEGFDMEVEGQGGVKSEASFWDWGGERQQVMISGVMVKQGSQTRSPGAN